MKHGIIVPCYNEASRLEMKTFIEFAGKRKDLHLCFVNDGSRDHTRSALASIKHDEHDNVYILDVAQNAGKANAVRQGALFLFDETEVDTIGFLDADLSTSFEEYKDLLETYEKSNGGVQIIFGSRNMKGGGAAIDRNPLRKIISDFIRVLIFGITRLKIADTQCGAKVFDRNLIPIIYDTSFFSRWLFDVEILLRLKNRLGKMDFLEIFLEKPLKSWVHKDDSKLSAKDSIMIPFNLLKIWMEYAVKPALSRFKYTLLQKKVRFSK